ncbi:N-acetyl-alpha-D-glucosaminyl L-malate synthase BshA [Paucihalobacter ruber]|uniref:N-acetyl-alpha-D-glucosaminyl L-malate synthase BshA n=1 Tax=Paucihalobacter ruber TaxID=2567861 RepID=A0A506PHZ9_9FLAO|nr:N-acetyl-alpha-D-glucosaminyl L-malate synthase BshA [Paucihalobacter ruber]TPV33463.1 N-acetyl-alpha-D-glucosaminyl L-malate synthase BshA [Paucihalobacter ruber]
MRIGIVCYPTFGGSGVVATELGMELAKKGHEIHFITYNQPVRLDSLSKNVHYHEVHVPEYPLFLYQPYELALSSKIVDMARLHQIELLHVHYAIPHAYAAYMAKQILKEEGIHIPVVTTLHGTDITLVGSHPVYKPAVTFSINKSDAVTAVSEDLKAQTQRIFKVKKEIHVVPNFIDLDRHQPNFTDCQRTLMAKDHERIITHISNFRKVKQIPDVIQIFNNIQKEIPAKLMMVGDGPEREPAELLCKKLGIENKVVFFGNSNEIDKILCFSDLFLLPSISESFGLAALEAMAFGVPVISTNAGGIPEVNKQGYSGFLSNVNDIEDMSKNALKILKRPEDLKQFKLNAKNQASIYNIHKIVPKYEAIYKQALKDIAALI